MEGFDKLISYVMYVSYDKLCNQINSFVIVLIAWPVWRA